MRVSMMIDTLRSKIKIDTTNAEAGYNAAVGAQEVGHQLTEKACLEKAVQESGAPLEAETGIHSSGGQFEVNLLLRPKGR